MTTPTTRKTALFDLRVTHVNSKCQQTKKASEVFKEHEDEKKRKYQQQVLDVEMGSFTPVVFGTNDGMGNGSQRFLMYLADKIAQKDTELYNTVIAWLRTQISIFRTIKIGTRMRKRFTNAFAKQDRTLLVVQNKRHCVHLDFFGNFQAKCFFFSLNICTAVTHNIWRLSIFLV